MEAWYYNEFQQTGINFERDEEVKQYDEKYKKVRNLDQEVEGISKVLGLNSNSVVLEIGTGTGEMSILLSKICKKVYACDVSTAMLDYAINKVTLNGRNNIDFQHSGFRNYKK